MTHAQREAAAAAAPLVVAVGVEPVDEFELPPIPLNGPDDIGTIDKNEQRKRRKKYSLDLR